MIREAHAQPHRCNSRYEQRNLIQRKNDELVLEEFAAFPRDQDGKSDTGPKPNQQEKHDVRGELPSRTELGVVVEENRH